MLGQKDGPKFTIKKILIKENDLIYTFCMNRYY